MLGVGYHHAGLDVSDRKMIEKAFMLSDLPVLCEIQYCNMSATISESRFYFIFFYFFISLHNNRQKQFLVSYVLTLLLIVVSQ